MEKLKQAASKGLNIDKYARLPAERAGSIELVTGVRLSLIKNGVMTCLYHILNNLFKGFSSKNELSFSTLVIIINFICNNILAKYRKDIYGPY